MSVSRPISLTLAALGGQGGGVVSGWLTEVARREGYLVQATSVPGVAQRTGATIYYLEFFPEALLPGDGRRPVMALMPNPGDVDVVVASELVEAGRVMQRGLVTPGRTTLIASTHRSYTISEKSHGGDGRASSERILEDARASARRLLAFDMAAVATAQGAMISAVILGSIAGANVLPFRPDAYRETIRAGKVAVELNLAGFDAGVAAARAASEERGRASAAAASPEGAARLPGVPTDLALRIDREIPEPARATARHGVARVVDYQDARHAGSYLEQLERFAALDREHGDGAARLTESVARGLALWMSFEDTIRVADLKTRIDRHERIRASVKARPAELVQVSEYVRPRVAEICGTLPASLGRRILESPRLAAAMARLTSGRRIRTDTVSGFMLLRLVAGLRRWRRGTLRFEQEMSRARSWLDAVARIAPRDYGLAVELAECQKLVRGYGDTHDRGWRNFERLVAAAPGLEGKAGSADALARLRRSALDSDADADADADAGMLTASRGA